jgi:valyl-tRNA synthetase
MGEYQFGEALREIHEFLWNQYCDWYLELSKIRLKEASSPSPLPVLIRVLENGLRLLHPFMPFITEELWQHIKPYIPDMETGSIMVSPYPEGNENEIDEKAENVIELLMEIIRSLRNLRAEHGVDLDHYIQASVYAGHLKPVLEPYRRAVEFLARARPAFFDGPVENRERDDISIVLRQIEIIVPLRSLVDIDKQRQRLAREIEALEADVARLSKHLQDEKFLNRAPSAVVEKERSNLEERATKLQRLKVELERL